jgi:hypothetical protein
LGLAGREEGEAEALRLAEGRVDQEVIVGGDGAVVVEIPVGPMCVGNRAGVGAVEEGVVVGVDGPVEVGVAGDGQGDGDRGAGVGVGQAVG